MAGIDDPIGHFGNALQTASYEGEELRVEQLLNAGANVNARGGQYDTALQVASYRGHLSIVKMLLEAGAQVNAQGGFYDTALQAASYNGHWTIVQQLLEAHANPNSKAGVYGSAMSAAWQHKRVMSHLMAADGDAEAVLIHALKHKRGADVLLLLEMGTSADAQDGKDGTTALQVASYEGHESIVDRLLECGADVNTQGGRYGTALQAACLGQRTRLVDRLLKAGADVNARAGRYGSALQTVVSQHNKGATAIILHGMEITAQADVNQSPPKDAMFRHIEEIIKLLLEAGADVNTPGGIYGSALQAAAASLAEEKIIETLLEAGADVNAPGGKYGSALQAAAATPRGKEKIIQVLLEAGADINASGGIYGSALQAAAASRAEEKVIRMLLGAGADVNAPGGEFGSALQLAVSRGNEKIVQILLESGADVHTLDGRYNFALEAALARRSKEIVLMLLEYGANVNVRNKMNSTRGLLSEITDLFQKKIPNERPPSVSVNEELALLQRLFAWYCKTGHFSKAVDLNKSIADKQNELSLSDRDRLLSKHALARALLNDDRPQEAVKLLKVMLQAQKDNLRERHSDELATQSLLDEVHETVRKRREARKKVRAIMDSEDRGSVDSQSAKRIPPTMRIEDAHSTSIPTKQRKEASQEGQRVKDIAEPLKIKKTSASKRQLLLLHIAKVIPKHLIKFTKEEDRSWVNFAKLFLERYTGHSWDWTPFDPPVPLSQHRGSTMEWKIHPRKSVLCLTTDEAKLIQQHIEQQMEHPSWCLCCRFRTERIEWKTVIQRMWTAFTLWYAKTSAQSAYEAGGQISQIDQTRSNEGSHTAGSTRPEQEEGSKDKLSDEVSSGHHSIPVDGLQDYFRWVLFSVRGVGLFLDVPQIPVEPITTDQTFFRTLLRRYRESRRWWKLYFSPYRFYRCRFVQIKKMGSERLISAKDHLPDSHGFAKDYDYDPRPPEADIPLLLDDEWRVYLQVCEDNCYIRLFKPWHMCWSIIEPDPEPPPGHAIVPPSPEQSASKTQPSALCRIPKRKAPFDTISKRRIGQLAFGIETDYEISGELIVWIHVLTLSPTFAFWTYWMLYHPGDLQNASVPFFTVVALLGALWIVSGRGSVKA